MQNPDLTATVVPLMQFACEVRLASEARKTLFTLRLPSLPPIGSIIVPKEQEDIAYRIKEILIPERPLAAQTLEEMDVDPVLKQLYRETSLAAMFIVTVVPESELALLLSR